MNDRVEAQVSEYSRQHGRLPPDELLEKLKLERDELIQEKRDVEFKLSETLGWKQQETSRILSRRLSKTKNIELTARMQSDYRTKTSPLIKEKQAIEKRLHDIKSRLSGKEQRQDGLLKVALRIEKLLQEILEKVND